MTLAACKHRAAKVIYAMLAFPEGDSEEEWFAAFVGSSHKKVEWWDPTDLITFLCYLANKEQIENDTPLVLTRRRHQNTNARSPFCLSLATISGEKTKLRCKQIKVNWILLCNSMP